MFDKLLWKGVNIGHMQCGFMRAKRTTGVIFIAISKKSKKLYFAFINLEKSSERVPRKMVQWSVRKLGVAECFVQAVMALYRVLGTRV